MFFEKFLSKKEQEVKYLLGLLFTEREIKVVLISEIDGKKKMLGSVAGIYDRDWERALEVVDGLISKVSADIPDERIEEVILGIPAFWTTEGKILKEYLAKLKKISTELDLRPIGFVTIIEALIFWLQKKEGVPLTTIILGFLGDKIEVSLIRAGRVEKSKTVEKGDGPLGELIVNKLKVFADDGILPTRILVYGDNKKLSDIKEDLISYPWVDKANFLHFPKIEICEEDMDLQGLISSAGIYLKSEELVNRKEKKEDEKEPEQSGEFGFVVGEDVAEEKKKDEKESFVEEEKLRVDKGKEDERGEKTEDSQRAEKETAKEGDVELAVDLVAEKDTKTDLSGKEKKPVGLPVSQTDRLVGKIRKGVSEMMLFANVKAFFIDLVRKKPDISGFFKKRALLVLVGVLILAGAVLGFYWYVPRVTLVILVEPKVLEQEVDIFITSDEKEISKKTLLAEMVEVKEEGSKTAVTTGKKVVGEKSKGEVMVYNKTTTSEKKFSKGTTISSGSWSFIFDEDVSVASASSGLESTTFGKATVKVTAVEIGDEGNLAAGKTFSVEDFPGDLYTAYNTKSFSGGSSREIRVVSEEDREKLLTSLSNKLIKEGKEKLLTSSDSDSMGKLLIDKGIKTKVIEEKYSKDTGDEARELTLKLKINISGMAVDKKDLDDYLKEKIRKSVPADYKFDESTIETEVVNVGKEKNGKLPLTIFYKTDLIPELDIDELKREIMGRKVEVVESYFKGLPLVVGFEADIKPRIRIFTSSFPRVAGNIEIKVELYNND